MKVVVRLCDVELHDYEIVADSISSKNDRCLERTVLGGDLKTKLESIAESSFFVLCRSTEIAGQPQEVTEPNFPVAVKVSVGPSGGATSEIGGDD